MRKFFDTSVIVPGLVEGHPVHRRANLHVVAAREGEIQMLLSTHAIAESFNRLTTLEIKDAPRISVQDAKLMLKDLASYGEIVELAPSDYWMVVDRMVNLNQPGPKVYDALHAQAAIKASADRLLTFDTEYRDRLGPNVAELVEIP